MKIFILITLLIFFGIRCKKSESIYGPQSIPYVLYFVIKQNGHRLPDSVLNYVNLYYFNSGNKTYVRDFSRATSEGYNLGVLASREIAFISADNSIKTFFLEYQTGDVDTIFADFKHAKGNESLNNSCYCSYPLQLIKYNDQLAPFDSSITQQKVYLFSKN